MIFGRKYPTFSWHLPETHFPEICGCSQSPTPELKLEWWRTVNCSVFCCRLHLPSAVGLLVSCCWQWTFLSPDVVFMWPLLVLFLCGRAVSTVLLVCRCCHHCLASVCPNQLHFHPLSWSSRGSSTVFLVTICWLFSAVAYTTRPPPVSNLFYWRKPSLVLRATRHDSDACRPVSHSRFSPTPAD